MRRHLLLATLSACTLVGAAPRALAQTQRSGNESQKLMQQYQQLASERTAMQLQLAALKKDLDGAKSDLAGVKKERDALRARMGSADAAIAQAKISRQGAEENVEKGKQRMAELVARAREIALNLRDVEIDRNKLRTDLAERDRAYDSCAEANLGLYEVSSEILSRYEHTGLFTRAAATEPFTRLTRTRIENLVDDYRARAEELRVKKRPAESPAAESGSRGVQAGGAASGPAPHSATTSAPQ